MRSVFFLLLALCGAVGVRADAINLAGPWSVALGTPATATQWQPIQLPGVLDDAGIGTPLTLQPALDLRVLAHLQRRFSYVGSACYRRTVEIPPCWAGKRITLEMERVLWESRVWVDGRELSRDDSLTTPHRHDLSAALTPGRHELLVEIDNREIHPDVSLHVDRYGDPQSRPVAHAYTNHTQIMWNGVLGSLRLVAEERTAIRRLALYPRLTPGPGIAIDATCSNANTQPVPAILKLTLRRFAPASAGPVVAEWQQPCLIPANGGAVHVDWTLPTSVAIAPWDEFAPNLYGLEATLADAGSAAPSTVTATFGFREIAARNGDLMLNGHRIFLRGDLECAAFPLTGYPPTDVVSWRKRLQQAKSWGLNHLRFHSWCPPEAAFAAADELGLYLQIELPQWSLSVGHNPATWRFLQDEADRIVAEYGNHPSFLLFSMGNELEGDFGALNALVQHLRATDPRRLHTTTTFTFQRGHGQMPEPADEYFVTQHTADGWVRGQGVFNNQPPAFDAEYRTAIARISVPVISHEIGQYAVYPDLREISAYTGNLVPLNFIAVRDDLARKGLLPLAPQFTAASGRFAALLYKEEIERALRTPQLDGFQLLELQDFPGQGTALVGLLNAFWEPKGFVAAEEFREACAPVTPLARLPKAVYERGEVLRVPLEVANFYRDLPQAEVTWTVHDAGNRTLGSGAFAPATIAVGGARPVGEITLAIPADGEAAQWQLEVAIRGTPFRNHWNLWVYPRAVVPVPGNVRLATDLAAAKAALAAGERVLFAPEVHVINGIAGRFVPVFWSPVHFPDQPGTMGLWCDPHHPALRDFPTEFHSDWQWWDPVVHSRSVVLDGLAATPIVRVIDNFTRNHSLANVFEARVGTGRLLFCAIDITHELETRPVARQLRASLLRYAASPEFAPQPTLAPEQLDGLILPRPTQ